MAEERKSLRDWRRVDKKGTIDRISANARAAAAAGMSYGKYVSRPDKRLILPLIDLVRSAYPATIRTNGAKPRLGFAWIVNEGRELYAPPKKAAKKGRTDD